MSVAEEVALTGTWISEQEELMFIPEGTYHKKGPNGTIPGNYRIELDESVSSLVLDLFPTGKEAERYTFTVVLNNDGMFLSLFHPLHVQVGHYKKLEE